MAQAAGQARSERSLGELFAELSRDTGTLIRKEIELARLELTQKARLAGINVGYIVAGGAVAYAGLLVILAGIVLGLTALGVPGWASALLVGIVVAAVGGLMARSAISTLNREGLKPTETIETMKENVEWAKHPTK
ncbi:MAG TPA: phage holin family protein [Vicinamibacterales bacterium]